MIAEITWVHWTAFILAVILFLAMDLGLFHRKAHAVRFKEALLWTGIWIAVAMGFAWGLNALRGQEEALEFLTGYIVELSLSMDNVFVIALIFRYFQVPLAYQHRVLFWGIMGALVLRGSMIWAGAALVRQFEWTLIVFGAFLVFSGIKLLFAKEESVEPEKNILMRLARRFMPIAPSYDQQRFVTIVSGRRMFTPLVLVLIMVEATDLIFALDSIPAIFGITTKEFIVFTSNVFAILGLRSLYFALAGAIDYFRFLKFGLSLVLVFIGVKMLLLKFIHIATPVSLGVIGTIILCSIGLSLVSRWIQIRKALKWKAISGKEVD
ncbi:TerC family protein [Desulfobacter sp.]|uniref:TerC family protein n=1 Tax=Desulfobacter sp. TaxID=2294 RepID=UPI003D0F3A32